MWLLWYDFSTMPVLRMKMASIGFQISYRTVYRTKWWSGLETRQNVNKSVYIETGDVFGCAELGSYCCCVHDLSPSARLGHVWIWISVIHSKHRMHQRYTKTTFKSLSCPGVSYKQGYSVQKSFYSCVGTCFYRTRRVRTYFVVSKIMRSCLLCTSRRRPEMTREKGKLQSISSWHDPNRTVGMPCRQTAVMDTFYRCRPMPMWNQRYPHQYLDSASSWVSWKPSDPFPHDLQIILILMKFSLIARSYSIQTRYEICDELRNGLVRQGPSHHRAGVT